MSKKKKPAVDGTIQISRPSAKRQVLGSTNEKTVTIYANNAFIEVTNLDVKIRLGQIQSATPEAISVLDVAHVYMSHEHAKRFAEVLATTLAKTEVLKLAGKDDATVQ